MYYAVCCDGDGDNEGYGYGDGDGFVVEETDIMVGLVVCNGAVEVEADTPMLGGSGSR